MFFFVPCPWQCTCSPTFLNFRQSLLDGRLRGAKTARGQDDQTCDDDRRWAKKRYFAPIASFAHDTFSGHDVYSKLTDMDDSNEGVNFFKSVVMM